MYFSNRGRSSARVAETIFAELGALVFREPGIEEVSLGVGPVQEPSGLLFLHDKGDSGEMVVQHECPGLSHDLLADVCERTDWEQHALKCVLRDEAGRLDRSISADPLEFEYVETLVKRIQCLVL